ncbi:hypothetical protein CTI12_AA246430 [Artemisia annua]|uniref:Uncharacterized protein n=1 Tax=Artemisia annua TaxID=35608 RepID=A0A2U1NNF3_ARTAN|nr:hypothetical protein CTI12_AA246430 [Artemisia annua]
MVKTKVEDLKKNNKELKTDRSESISFCSFKDKVEKANLEHINKDDTYAFPRIIPSFKRKRISNIIISDDENSNANEEDMAGYEVRSWGANRTRSKRVVKVRSSDSETSCDDNVPISTLIRRRRIKTDSEDEGDHDLNSTDSLYNGHTSTEYEESDDDLEEVSESSDEDEENNDDLEEDCESSDESMDDSSENDFNRACGGGNNGDESDNDSSKSISLNKDNSSEEKEDNDDLEEEPEGEVDSLNGSTNYIEKNDSDRANEGGDDEDEGDHDLNITDSIYNGHTSSDYEESNDYLEEVSESSDEDEEINDDLEEDCESSDESMDDSSENDFNRACGGGNSGDESDNDSSKSISLNKDNSSEEKEDNDDLEEEPEDGSIGDSSQSDSECSYEGGDTGDECEDTSNDLQQNKKSQRKKVWNRKWDLEGDMLADFGKDPELCMRAVCAIYRQQTADEKASQETRYRNGRGFSQFDAPGGCKLAEFLTDRDPAGDLNKTVEDLKQYDSKGIKRCRKLAANYSKQLFKIYKNKEDPYFPSNSS